MAPPLSRRPCVLTAVVFYDARKCARCRSNIPAGRKAGTLETAPGASTFVSLCWDCVTREMNEREARAAQYFARGPACASTVPPPPPTPQPNTRRR
jgi:hypothetical protein